MSVSHAASRQAEIDRVGRGAGEGSLGDGIAICIAATGASPPVAWQPRAFFWRALSNLTGLF